MVGYGQGHYKRKDAALTHVTLNLYISMVDINDVFYDGEPEPGASLLTRPGLVDPVKTFKNPM